MRIICWWNSINRQITYTFQFQDPACLISKLWSYEAVFANWALDSFSYIVFWFLLRDQEMKDQRNQGMFLYHQWQPLQGLLCKDNSVVSFTTPPCCLFRHRDLWDQTPPNYITSAAWYIRGIFWLVDCHLFVFLSPTKYHCNGSNYIIILLL